jgi:hypothetical protein
MFNKPEPPPAKKSFLDRFRKPNPKKKGRGPGKKARRRRRLLIAGGVVGGAAVVGGGVLLTRNHLKNLKIEKDSTEELLKPKPSLDLPDEYKTGLAGITVGKDINGNLSFTPNTSGEPANVPKIFNPKGKKKTPPDPKPLDLKPKFKSKKTLDLKPFSESPEGKGDVIRQPNPKTKGLVKAKDGLPTNRVKRRRSTRRYFSEQPSQATLLEQAMASKMNTKLAARRAGLTQPDLDYSTKQRKRRPVSQRSSRSWSAQRDNANRGGR